MTDLRPFCESFGVGAAASDPSPRKRGPSSVFANCAASRIVNGRTRTVTEMLDAPSAAAMLAIRWFESSAEGGDIYSMVFFKYFYLNRIKRRPVQRCLLSMSLAVRVGLNESWCQDMTSGVAGGNCLNLRTKVQGCNIQSRNPPHSRPPRTTTSLCQQWTLDLKIMPS